MDNVKSSGVESPGRTSSTIWESLADFVGGRLSWFYVTFVLFAFLAFWEVAVRIFDIPDFILPGPLGIVEEMFVEWELLFRNSLVTLQELLLGFVLGVTIGILLAIGIVYSRIFEQVAYPILITFQTIPKIVLAPILVIWFGFGIMPKVLLAALICFFVMVINTVVGMRSVRPNMLHLVRSMRASRWQILQKVQIPAALPNIFAGLKVAITLALVGAIVGEYIASDNGLGFVQLRANEFLDITLQFAAVAVVAAMGTGLFLLVVIAERFAIPWRRTAE